MIRINKRIFYVAIGLILTGVAAVTVLTIMGPDIEEMQVTPADQDPALVDTGWTLTSLNGETPRLEITLYFTDVEAGGGNGCNGYNGPYQSRDGKSIKFGFLSSTQKLCSDDPGYHEDNNAYFTALGKATSYVIDGDTLKMGTRQNPDALIFERIP